MNEAQLLKKIIYCSFAIHLAVFFWPFDYKSNKILKEDKIIEIDLVSFDEVKEEKLNLDEQETKVIKKSLPQVPKKMSIIDEKSDTEEIVSEVEYINKQQKKVEKKQEKNTEDKKNIQIAKEEALKRILQDKARREKKFVKKEEEQKVRLTQSLLDRKKSLDAKKISQSYQQNGSTYYAIIKKWIDDRYFVPKIYESFDLQKDAVIQLQLSHQGSILKIRVLQSSENISFDKLAMETIRKAEPYPFPPEEWVGKSIDITMSVSK